MKSEKISLVFKSVFVVCCCFLLVSEARAGGAQQGENCPTVTGCGDGVCSAALGETMISCIPDCGMPPVTCSDGVCSFGSAQDCACDPTCKGVIACGAVPTSTTTVVGNPNCGNPTVCSYGDKPGDYSECGRCPECIGVTACGVTTTTTTLCDLPTPTPTPVFCDNDGVCELNRGETTQKCPDCVATCGDGICNSPSENNITCPCDCVTSTTTTTTTTSTTTTTTTTTSTTTTTTVPCKLYKASFRGTVAKYGSHATFNYTDTNGKPILSCLNQYMQKARTDIGGIKFSNHAAGGRTHYSFNDGSSKGRGRFTDDRFMRHLWMSFIFDGKLPATTQWSNIGHGDYGLQGTPGTPSYAGLEELRNNYAKYYSFINCQTKTTVNSYSGTYNNGFGGASYGMGDKTAANKLGCSNGDFYFDQNCKLLDPKTAEAQCGKLQGKFDFHWYISTTSPISLMWEKDADIEKKVSFVRFKLDPTSNKEVWSWKASAKTPLLVYDPKHSGKITSAFQLFGDWTFGGRRLASLLGSKSSELAKKWDNGYEALKTLDNNGDGKISDSELAPLALWFDENQNAISEEGEVKSITTTGVKSIYFTYDRVDEKTKSIHASIGFEREVNGVVEKGASVDWYGEGAQSEFELYSKHILSSIEITPNSASAKKEPSKELNENKPSAYGSNPEKKEEVKDVSKWSSEISGGWLWSLTEAQEKSPDLGLLVFSESSDGTFAGMSAAEVPVAEGGKNLKSIVVFNSLEGTTKKLEDGKIEIAFKVNIKNEGMLTSKAVISKDRLSMNGSSEALVDGKSVKYNWQAYRTEMKE